MNFWSLDLVSVAGGYVSQIMLHVEWCGEYLPIDVEFSRQSFPIHAACWMKWDGFAESCWSLNAAGRFSRVMLHVEGSGESTGACWMQRKMCPNSYCIVECTGEFVPSHVACWMGWKISRWMLNVARNLMPHVECCGECFPINGAGWMKRGSCDGASCIRRTKFPNQAASWMQREIRRCTLHAAENISDWWCLLNAAGNLSRWMMNGDWSSGGQALGLFGWHCPADVSKLAFYFFTFNVFQLFPTFVQNPR